MIIMLIHEVFKSESAFTNPCTPVLQIQRRANLILYICFMKRIVIDMDEVVADIYPHFIELYNKEHNLSLHISQFDGKEIKDGVPEELSHLVYEYINRPKFFRDLPLIKDSVEVIEALTQKYDVYFVSAAMEFPNSLKDKYEWIQEHFPFISWKKIVLCGDKIVDADIMIDDRIRNLNQFKGERKLLFTSPHNLGITDYERVNNWKEVAEKLL